MPYQVRNPVGRYSMKSLRQPRFNLVEHISPLLLHFSPKKAPLSMTSSKVTILTYTGTVVAQFEIDSEFVGCGLMLFPLKTMFRFRIISDVRSFLIQPFNQIMLQLFLDSLPVFNEHLFASN